MADDPTFIELRLDTKAPIEIGDFVSVFSALAGQFEKFVRLEYPESAVDAHMYVTELRPGSIIADIIPSASESAALLAPVWEHVQKAIVDRFLSWIGDRLSVYLRGGGKDESANKSDLADLMGAIQAIANDPDGSATISEVHFEDGRRKVRAAIKFTTREARSAREHIEDHKRELERTSAADYERVVMVFTQSNIRDPGVGKRTGERVMIEKILPKDLPLIYASGMAEQAIKTEIRDAEDNVFKKGFLVDVNVELKAGRPVAYRVTNLHQVFDLPDDE